MLFISGHLLLFLNYLLFSCILVLNLSLKFTSGRKWSSLKNFKKSILSATLTAIEEIAFSCAPLSRECPSLLLIVNGRKAKKNVFFELFCFFNFFPVYRVEIDSFTDSEYVTCFKIDQRDLEILGIKVLKWESAQLIC